MPDKSSCELLEAVPTVDDGPAVGCAVQREATPPLRVCTVLLRDAGVRYRFYYSTPRAARSSVPLGFIGGRSNGVQEGYFGGALRRVHRAFAGIARLPPIDM